MSASKSNEKQTGLTVFLKPTFVNCVLNQLLMMWQIRQALPWSQIEDPFLRTAFQFSNPKAVLYGRQWSADEAKKLYSVLKSHVFDELNGTALLSLGQQLPTSMKIGSILSNI
ncbi:hypothetical protein PCANC_09322 [Puccinia coronata f. sp. avenae]|uniref:Uncharacterized protein n=1 Tax=Puccinia coronata f. sp. avenae TaxID=200324 RepID=A0A2N5T5L4_9BASI|nr:hypothetical protein PCANC_09322 [Puccinia coronata f. sp. avenae]